MKKRMRIVVTGGAGFIGSHFVERLLSEPSEKNTSILIVDDFNNFYDPRLKKGNLRGILKDARVEVAKVDITNTAKITTLIQKFKPTHVVHLAARAGVRPSLEEPELYTRVNLLGTVNILEAVKKLKLVHFVFGSSSSIYGNNKKVPFAESDVTESQVSPYAITKRSGELICSMYAEKYEIPMTCLRFFTVYGPRQRPDLAIMKFMQRILDGKSIEMYGTGLTSRDYTYVDDIVDGIYKALYRKVEVKDFEIINLGNSSPVTLKKLISLIEKTVGKKARIKKMPMQPGDVERTYADIGKAGRMLGWKPQTKLEDGLEKMAAWLQKK